VKWPRWPKSPPLMTSLTKNPQPLTKKYFFECRLAASFEPLNSSLLLLAPKLLVCKATCDPVLFSQIPESGRMPKCEKDFFEDVIDKTPASIEINFLHKIVSTTNASRLWDWPTVKRHGYSLLCIKLCFFKENVRYLVKFQALPN